MKDSGALILVFGLFFIVLEYKGNLNIEYHGFKIAGPAGFVMVVLGAIMMGLG